MSRSSFANTVNLRYSEAGKLDVVKGVLSDREKLAENFIRRSQTAKSYGTLLAVKYSTGAEGQLMFPNARQDGGVFERPFGEEMVQVVEWAIPKVRVLFYQYLLYTESRN